MTLEDLDKDNVSGHVGVVLTTEVDISQSSQELSGSTQRNQVTTPSLPQGRGTKGIERGNIVVSDESASPDHSQNSKPSTIHTPSQS